MIGNRTSSGAAELKQRLWFVFWGLVVFRIGVHIPVPGIDAERLALRVTAPAAR